MVWSVTSDQADTTGSSVTVNMPSGAAAGKTVHVVVYGNTTATLSDNNGSYPFTKDYQNNSESVEGSVVAVFSRTLTGGEGSTLTFNSTASDRLSAIPFCGGQAAVYDVAPSNTYTAVVTGTPSTHNSLDTTVADNSLHVVIDNADTGIYSITGYPSGAGYTEDENVSGGGGGQRMSLCHKEYATGAATGALGFTLSSGANGYVVSFSLLAAATIDQSAFAFGDDDGNEASHTLDTENTNYTGPANTPKTLRFQLDSTGNPASKTFDLYYQKNGSGGYGIIPVGATQVITPSPGTDSATLSGNNTASGSWPVSVPAYASGSLVKIGISWDDSTTTTDVTEPAGPNGETILEVNATPAASASTEVRCKVWYYVSTAAYAGGTLTFTPSASEQWTAAVSVDAPGTFDPTTPIGASTTNASAGTAESNIQHGAFSAGSTDGGGRLFVWTAADADPQTVASGFTQIGNQDIGNVTGGFFTRDTVVSDSESFSATTVSTIASDSWCTVAFVVRGITQDSEVYVEASSNISDAGADGTTNRLSTSGGTFQSGARIDDGTGKAIDLGDTYQTEIEYRINTKSGLTPGDYFEFQIGGLTAYDYTPKWTIGTGGSSYDDATTLAIYQAAAAAPQLDAVGSVPVGISQAIAGSSQLDAVGAATLAIYQAIGAGAIGSFDRSVALAVAQAISQEATGNFDRALTLALALAIEANGGAAFDDAVVLAQALGISASTSNEINAALALSQALAASPAGLIDAQAALTLAAAHGLLAGATADFSAALALAIAQALETAADVAAGAGTYDETVTLSQALGITGSSQLDAAGALTLTIGLAETASSGAALVAELALAHGLAAATIGQALIEAGIALDAVQAISIDGSVISVLAVTPSGRTFTVAIDARVFTILPETRALTVEELRTYLVPAEDRTFSIDAETRILTIH